jgi:6-phosphogluconolactonase (cycloisomerase 2 family)
MPIANATNPMGLLTTPDDAKNPSANAIFLYVAEAGTGQISVYEICDKPSLNCSNATADPGDLLEITGSPFAASGEPGSMVVVNPAVITPPSGTFLYVTDRKSNRLLQYSISVVTGNLTPLSPPAVSTGATPLWVAARHDGQYVFVVNNGSNSMSSYTMVDPKTGVLTPSVTAVTTTGNNPSTVLAK